MSASMRAAWQAILFVLASTCLFLPTIVHGAFINFDNCLDTRIVDSKPLQLQWIPLFVDARYDTHHPTHNLNITIYGNVSGLQEQVPYPPANSSHWTNDTETAGKITRVGYNNPSGLSTLFADFKVLTWDAYSAKPSSFCNSTVNATCPIGPAFTANASNPYELPAFSVAHNLDSPYSFTTLEGNIRVVSGDLKAPDLACINARITPDLGPRVTGLLTWLPAVVLILKGVATLSAAIWSPWGSIDIFRWSSNYGRDEDLLRLVTPGFGDCLQYIQFVTLTGALSLQYPGFYQPAVSQTSWSLLLFNNSFVSHGNGSNSLIDGIYAYNGTYGMTAMSQLIGMDEVEDIWACMAIYLLAIAVGVALLCQLGFFARWIYRTATNTTEEDLRQKNFPFTMGNMVRLLFNYFILPIVALSLFQLVTAPSSPSAVVATAVVLLVIMILGGAWIFRIIFSTKPRTILFDDMPMVLLYGPLYNTYSDSAAPFALIPVFITFMRGVALGAIQPSGIAQIIVLAICEVILILTLNGFRPFQGQTSMNAYHTSFAAIRLITILLSVTFIRPLGIGEAARGWVGYIILFLHACVLVFGFFLNSAQTLIEVIARACGVGGDSQHGAVRGSILNMRMLKKRQDRPVTRDRASMGSNAAILHRDSMGNNLRPSGRSRSVSASSNQLLNHVGAGTPSTHRMSGLENFSATPSDYPVTPGTDTEMSRSGFTYLPAGDFDSGAGGLKSDQEGFYRPPRPRKATMDTLSQSGKVRPSGDFPYQDSPDGGRNHGRQASGEPSYANRDSPAPAFFRLRADSDDNVPRTDYAVREVDQYYRGPPLSDLPTRNLKTGPADPVGPAASAQSWFQRVMYGMKNKKKEPSKGFEVTRTGRMPLAMQRGVPEDVEMQTSPAMNEEPYSDTPPAQQGESHKETDRGLDAAEKELSPSHQKFNFEFDGATGEASSANISKDLTPSRQRSQRTVETDVSNYDKLPSIENPDKDRDYLVSPEPPSLGPIDTVGNIDMPSRWQSHRSTNLNSNDVGRDWLGAVDNLSWNHESHNPAAGRATPPPQSTPNTHLQEPSPSVPRRSSRRTLSQDIPAHHHPYNAQPSRLATTTDHGDVFAGFDSGNVTPVEEGRPARNFRLESPARHSGSGDRPESVTRVSRHRAADSITRNSFGASAAMQGTSAEIFDGTTSPTTGHYHDNEN